MNSIEASLKCDGDSPTGVIGLIEHFGAAEVLALSVRLRVVRRGAKHLHNFVVVVLKEMVNFDGKGTKTPRTPLKRSLHMC